MCIAQMYFGGARVKIRSAIEKTERSQGKLTEKGKSTTRLCVVCGF
jgi:hypothetical protein